VSDDGHVAESCGVVHLHRGHPPGRRPDATRLCARPFSWAVPARMDGGGRGIIVRAGAGSQDRARTARLVLRAIRGVSHRSPQICVQRYL
jgi:hypothetical protein